MDAPNVFVSHNITKHKTRAHTTLLCDATTSIHVPSKNNCIRSLDKPKQSVEKPSQFAFCVVSDAHGYKHIIPNHYLYSYLQCKVELFNKLVVTFKKKCTLGKKIVISPSNSEKFRTSAKFASQPLMYFGYQLHIRIHYYITQSLRFGYQIKLV